VDAWATWEPFISVALKEYDGRILADGAQIGSDNAVTLMASTKFVAQNRDLLQLLFDTAQSDNAWSMEHKSEAGRIWAEAMGISPSLGDAIGAANAVPTTAVTPASLRQMDQIATWYTRKPHYFTAARRRQRRGDVAVERDLPANEWRYVLLCPVSQGIDIGHRLATDFLCHVQQNASFAVVA
jgi:ABC-type nitrate/sulfonate/bicarbonate transport system substrate-binding protein